MAGRRGWALRAGRGGVPEGSTALRRECALWSASHGRRPTVVNREGT